jgi:hypothetical protein
VAGQPRRIPELNRNRYASKALLDARQVIEHVVAVLDPRGEL